MAKADWTTVRVSKATKAKLEQLRAAMTTADDRATLPLDSEQARSGQADKRDRIGLDRVIRRLIADRERWQARRAASAKRRAHKPGQAGQQDTKVSPGSDGD